MSELSTFTWNVYHEPADTDDPAKWIGTIPGISMGDALMQASQYYEIPNHDLVVKRADLDPDRSYGQKGEAQA